MNKPVNSVKYQNFDNDLDKILGLPKHNNRCVTTQKLLLPTAQDLNQTKESVCKSSGSKNTDQKL